MKRILKILSVVVAVVGVAGIAIGLRPHTHAFGSVFQIRYRSSAASAPCPVTGPAAYVAGVGACNGVTVDETAENALVAGPGALAALDL